MRHQLWRLMELPDLSAGLCASCSHGREIHNRRGSVFLFCERSSTDGGYPKYPTLPVRRCPGYDQQVDTEAPDE
jgi:hypothetical protein